MGNWAQLYADLTAQLQAGQALGFWDNAFVGFYQSFVAAGRWRLYLNGLLTTLEATILALLLVVLGRGASEISSTFGLNQSFSDILTGIILFFIIGSEFFITYRVSLRKGGKKEA